MQKRLTILVILFTLKSLAQTPPSASDSARRRFMQAPVGTVTPTRETSVHDPVMIKENDTYYIFCTGNGISSFSSKDMKNWRRRMPVFSRIPQWVIKEIPGFKGAGIWAPDISFHNGKYYLYYAVS